MKQLVNPAKQKKTVAARVLNRPPTKRPRQIGCTTRTLNDTDADWYNSNMAKMAMNPHKRRMFVLHEDSRSAPIWVLLNPGTEYRGDPEYYEYQLAFEKTDHLRSKTESPQSSVILERPGGAVPEVFDRVVS